MTVSLRDLKTAKKALHEPCRSHPEHPAASCQICHEWALRQQERQWRRQREAAHVDYLERISSESL